MELSTLVAKIISIIYISSAIAILLRTIDFNNIVNDFIKSPALTFVAGSVGIATGLVLIEYHNLWVNNWSIVITIISWLFLIGGIVVVIFPKSLTLYNNFIKNTKLLALGMFVIGIVMGYLGFMN